MPLLFAMLSLATAGTGPWVPGSGVGNVYFGLEGEQFTTVSTGRESTAIGEGVQSISAVGVLTYGIAPRMEVEFSVPYRATHVNRIDADLCKELGDDACETTHTVGVLEARLKLLVIDGIVGNPISLALRGDVRYGGLTATTRHRLTSAGEGTTDFGPSLSMGRSGTLGKQGFYALSTDLGWRYRVPNTRRFPNQAGTRSVPGSEFHGNLEALVSPRGRVSFGPYSTALYRPQGVDFADLVVADPDRFGALRIADVRVGAKVLIRDAREHVFVLSVARTVYAWNNPQDTLTIGFGVSMSDVFGKNNRADP